MKIWVIQPTTCFFFNIVESLDLGRRGHRWCVCAQGILELSLDSLVELKALRVLTLVSVHAEHARGAPGLLVVLSTTITTTTTTTTACHMNESVRILCLIKKDQLKCFLAIHTSFFSFFYFFFFLHCFVVTLKHQTKRTKLKIKIKRKMISML